MINDDYDNAADILPIGIYMNPADMHMYCVYESEIGNKDGMGRTVPEYRDYTYFDMNDHCNFHLSNRIIDAISLIPIKDAAMLIRTKEKLMKRVKERKEFAEQIMAEAEAIRTALEQF